MYVYIQYNVYIQRFVDEKKTDCYLGKLTVSFGGGVTGGQRWGGEGGVFY